MQNAKYGNLFLKILVSLVAGVMLVLLVGKWVSMPKEHSEISKPVDLLEVAKTESEAKRGVAVAQFNLGSIYAKGLGVTQSYAFAAKWFRLAADQGQANAQLALGELYEVGQGVTRDESEAAHWYRRASEKGLAEAQYSLAALYVLGKGVPANDVEAMKWYRLAADQGDALSQYNLGMRYSEGKDVTAEPVQAYQWLSLAAAQGITDASEARAALKSRMTREQLAEGERLVSAFVPKTNSASIH